MKYRLEWPSTILAILAFIFTIPIYVLSQDKWALLVLISGDQSVGHPHALRAYIWGLLAQNSSSAERSHFATFILLEGTANQRKVEVCADFGE
jgi:hypothetical protein